jgi:predicted DCC family thiol-disulfide oxidoreductase YuxK
LDSEKKLLFTTSDSTHVRPLLEKSNIDATADETVLFGLHGKIYEKSDAVIEILKHLNRPYYYLGYIKFLPKGLRDAIYEIIASNRYRIFGKRKECMIPDRSIKERFI